MIHRIRTARRHIPLVETQLKGRVPVEGRQESVFVRIEDGDGVAGHGEASAWPAFSGQSPAAIDHVLTDLIAPDLVGLDERDRHGVRRAMDAVVLGNNVAKAALDMAVHDLTARNAGVPVCGLLGGDHAFTHSLSYSVSAPDAAGVAQAVEQKAADGYQVFKLKVGSFGATTDTERLVALRRAAPAAVLRLDYNCRAGENELRRLLPTARECGVDFVEQPFPPHQIRRLKRLRSWFDLPIALDESIGGPDSLDLVLEAGVCDVACLKFGIVGGTAAILEMAANAHRNGVRIYCGALNETVLGMTAALHTFSAAPQPAPGSDLYFPYEVLGTSGVEGGARREGGDLVLDPRPGYGVQVPDSWFD